jgi:hypothetical protein
MTPLATKRLSLLNYLGMGLERMIARQPSLRVRHRTIDHNLIEVRLLPAFIQGYLDVRYLTAQRSSSIGMSDGMFPLGNALNVPAGSGSTGRGE